MEQNISLLMIVKNASSTIEKSLMSVQGLVDTIVVVDNFSTDKTVQIAKKYGAKVYFYKGESLGEQRAYGLNKCRTEWVLVLDSDETVTSELKREIKSKLQNPNIKGFLIPFQNHLFGHPIKYGGEDYKMLRLFRKDQAKITPDLVHEKFAVSGKISFLKNKINHYSYRSLGQMYRKFTDYAVREAKQKQMLGEKSSLKKIFLYPPHMFWARFIKDKGYKDGIYRIPLDLGFGYMEFVTYWRLKFK